MKVEERERLTYERGLAICEANHYTDYTVFPNGRDACITRMGFNYAILADLAEWGYGDRWCFEGRWLAEQAMAEWIGRDGEGEPEGWHRHVDTGRRRPNGDASKEYINF